MKMQLCAAALCTLFASTNVAYASDEESLSELEQAAYDTGWSAANRYCQSLIPGPRRELFAVMGSRGARNITEEFKQACKMGYDNYIDSNQSCQQRLEQSGKYEQMWRARNNTCT
ncbi:hypothetical protein [Sorangium sp. So ce381]|uniref:hypothetical protein n=1 Tax=Sorangium sp. So ce381 TaxID=3133307 RepID=UPI003F5C3C0A